MGSTGVPSRPAVPSRARLGAVAAVSVLSAPLTAVWSLVLGWSGLLATTVAAMATTGPRRSRWWSGVHYAVALLVGPAAYLLLAVVSTGSA